MNKLIILWVMVGIGIQIPFCNPTVTPLVGLVSRQLFTFKNDDEKQKFNQQLIDGKFNIEELKFEGVTLKDIDLSGMYLRRIDFSGCTFINVNLQKADLTETRWDRVKFDDLSLLKGAILYYPPNEKDQAFRIDTCKGYDLVVQYSELMGQARKKEFDKSDPEVQVLLEKTDCLNNIIGSLDINLVEKNLQNFDLTDMKLGRVSLLRNSLQGVWLSKTIQVLNYNENNRTELFNQWADGVEEFQWLWNTGFDLTTGVASHLLRSTLEEKIKLGVDLSNGYLKNANLQGAHLENANFQHANLIRANLQGAHLENVNFQNASLWMAHLQGAHLEGTQLQHAHLQNAWLSKDVQVPEYPEGNMTELFNLWASGNKEYQKLWKARFSFIKGVDPIIVRRTLEEKVKLGVDLKRGFLWKINLQEAHLENANLKNTNLDMSNLEGAYLKNAQLQNACLYKANIKNAYLKNAQLQNVFLRGADLNGAYLKGTNLRGARLSWGYTLSYDKEEELMGLYHECQDQKTKELLKQIPIGKELMAAE